MLVALLVSKVDTEEPSKAILLANIRSNDDTLEVLKLKKLRFALVPSKSAVISIALAAFQDKASPPLLKLAASLKTFVKDSTLDTSKDDTLWSNELASSNMPDFNSRTKSVETKIEPPRKHSQKKVISSTVKTYCSW